MSARVTAPRVYAAISTITAELARSGIAKTRINRADNYSYRSIDDVCERLAPLLARHRLCILPRVLERDCTERRDSGQVLLVGVTVRMAFDIVIARDGSSHTIQCYGEALDEGDKATAKAMSSAYKHAVLQAFCVPASGEDADAMTQRRQTVQEAPDPDQGWDQWAADLQEMVRICETEEALDRVQSTYRPLLRACSKRRPELYSAIGVRVAERRKIITAPINLTASGSMHPSTKGHGK